MEESSRKASRPQLVTLDKAYKLAEQWVNNMTKITEDESAEARLEDRPYRLGIGATVPRQSKVGPLSDPVGRKLHAKLSVAKRNIARSNEACSSPNARDSEGDEDEEENLDSRTSVFSKKRAVPLNPYLQPKKKKGK
ncbi:uncharacterized protein LOC127813987 [Diospyros lotus]|uniref:uncharacterized protein LOC127813987 n=1 Tax=Diospyros lotus TaxID=55363 RepID=UPI002253DA7F|nr:uncharacterized protein LOC127813987 [Diospyros lotus]